MRRLTWEERLLRWIPTLMGLLFVMWGIATQEAFIRRFELKQEMRQDLVKAMDRFGEVVGKWDATQEARLAAVEKLTPCPPPCPPRHHWWQR